MAIARVTQSFVIAGTLQAGAARVTQSFVIIGVGLGISCGTPIDGAVGSPYSHTFPSGGGVAPVTFAVTVGSLPPGVTLNASTGVLTGVPTAPGAYAFTIQASDSMGQVASAACSIRISGLTSKSYGGAHRKCLESEMQPSRLNRLDWTHFSRILEAVKPEDVDEVRG